jgi:oxaloacetate decarboxylase alpha subunit
MARRRARSPRRPTKAVKSRPPATDNAADTVLGAVGLAQLRRLIRLVQQTGIGELEVKSGGRAVRVSAQSIVPQPVESSAGVRNAPSEGASPPPPAPAPLAKADHHAVITSPMVGTFYRAPAPDADPYVEVGDMVEVGQTVCIVEAMKLMNEIESEVRGRIVQILPENAQPVEFGQKLFLVEPA